MRFFRHHPLSYQTADGVIALPYGPTTAEKRAWVGPSRSVPIRDALGVPHLEIDIVWWIAVPPWHNAPTGRALRVVAGTPKLDLLIEEIDLDHRRALWPKSTEQRIARAGANPWITMLGHPNENGVEILVGGFWHPDSWQDPNCDHEQKIGVVCLICHPTKGD